MAVVIPSVTVVAIGAIPNRVSTGHAKDDCAKGTSGRMRSLRTANEAPG